MMTCSYPEHFKLIKTITGNAFCGMPDLALEGLWRIFSEVRYGCQFMVPDNAMVMEFMMWLQEEIHEPAIKPTQTPADL